MVLIVGKFYIDSKESKVDKLSRPLNRSDLELIYTKYTNGNSIESFDCLLVSREYKIKSFFYINKNKVYRFEYQYSGYSDTQQFTTLKEIQDNVEEAVDKFIQIYNENITIKTERI